MMFTRSIMTLELSTLIRIDLGTSRSKAISTRDKESRAKQKINHTSRVKSFAQLRYEQGQLREDGIQPNWIEMFKLMHAHKNGTPVDEVFHEIMARFDELLVAQM
ncbi:hypothetical protein VitviT2T_003995 [Vitis vinifera]|uniref:Pentatricopeptide repeat-containing protein n=2 Tax=Vitis vinifera TaxID=29760 RepID=A0ABY9BNM6_VITVI|nr:hypothetical protein CK203_051777 [Vitis vinifera]WJZ84389.1 hypothetical protein VitviT2T_003995 [Vitis vinifera]